MMILFAFMLGQLEISNLTAAFLALVGGGLCGQLCCGVVADR